jgi:hypothetical protein
MKYNLKRFDYTQTGGSISLLVLLFGLTASVAVGGLVMLTASQTSSANRNTANEQALSIAEAGINYYKWVLSHNGEDYTDGTGNPGSPGPYIHEYKDPQGNKVGQYSLMVTPPPSGSKIVTIRSTGSTEVQPGIKRTVEARFGVPSLAQFAFLHNSNVWFGQGMTIHGPVMTNGGIRMDGVNDSTLSTSKATYICGVETGCGTPAEKPGIWGNGGPQELWQFPVTNVDFANIRIDFDGMARAASMSAGLYLPNSGQQGYHIVFINDGTFKVYKVNTTDYYQGWSYDYLCQNLYQIIKKQTLLGTYNVADKPIIYAQDTLWVDGTLKGKTTVVAAQLPIDTYPRDIWIPDNLVYLDRLGDHRLGLIASRDIIFAKDVPKDFEVDGALLAQSSRVLRHHYNYSGCKDGNPAMKTSLTIYGSVISNLIAYWNFSGGGSEQPTSGFVKRELIYDPNMYYSPPPYFPSSGEPKLISWTEVSNP